MEAVIYFSVVDKFRSGIFAQLEARGGSANGRRELWFHHRLIRDH